MDGQTEEEETLVVKILEMLIYGAPTLRGQI